MPVCLLRARKGPMHRLPCKARSNVRIAGYVSRIVEVHEAKLSYGVVQQQGQQCQQQRENHTALCGGTEESEALRSRSFEGRSSSRHTPNSKQRTTARAL